MILRVRKSQLAERASVWRITESQRIVTRPITARHTQGLLVQIQPDAYDPPHVHRPLPRTRSDDRMSYDELAHQIMPGEDRFPREARDKICKALAEQYQRGWSDAMNAAVHAVAEPFNPSSRPKGAERPSQSAIYGPCS